MKILVCWCFITICFFGFSQVQKDTSFSLHSEFKKQLKKFPNIKIAQPISSYKLIENKDVIYQTSSNRNLHLDYYSKKGKEISPAIIMLHGGGWKSGNKSLLQPMAQQLALYNYQCFVVEFRLSDEAKYPAAIDDVLNAIDFIKKKASIYHVDTTKVAILGCSSGAQMASLVGTKYPNVVQVIVNIDGILAFHHPESQEGNLAAHWLGGTYEEIPAVWQDASALNHVSKKCPPILFINSQYDRFHAGRDDMIQKLNEYEIYSKIEKIDESPHTFWLFEPWFDPTITFIKQFLDNQLKNKK